MTPSDGFDTFFNRSWIAWAPLCPIRPCNWSTTAPWAASCPNARPATAIAISSSGAMENTV